MSECECVVGLLRVYEDAQLVTLKNLKVAIYETAQFNRNARYYGYNDIVRNEWTLKDYADKRKNTNLTRFDFCPLCGKTIDWAAIRRGDNAVD